MTSIMERLRCPDCGDLHGLYALRGWVRHALERSGPDWRSLCIKCASTRLHTWIGIEAFSDELDAKINDIVHYAYELGVQDGQELKRQEYEQALGVAESYSFARKAEEPDETG